MVNEVCGSILTKSRITRVGKCVQKALEGSLGFNRLLFEAEGVTKTTPLVQVNINNQVNLTQQRLDYEAGRSKEMINLNGLPVLNALTGEELSEE